MIIANDVSWPMLMMAISQFPVLYLTHCCIIPPLEDICPLQIICIFIPQGTFWGYLSNISQAVWQRACIQYCFIWSGLWKMTYRGTIQTLWKQMINPWYAATGYINDFWIYIAHSGTSRPSIEKHLHLVVGRATFLQCCYKFTDVEAQMNTHHSETFT